jgi:uncharacterized sulfatase
MRGAKGFEAAAAEMRKALDDRSPYVRIVAAQALGEHGNDEDLKRALRLLADHSDWSKHEVFVCMAALNALDALGAKAKSASDALTNLPIKGKAPDARYSGYVSRLLQDLQTGLK